jgi:uncharacterized protein (DUF433 family)
VIMTVVSTLIEIDDRGVAWISNANVKVVEVAMDKIAHGWSPEEMHFQHPNLSLAQIHAALAYYYENQERLDMEIDRGLREVNELAAQAQGNTLQQKLRRMKTLR